LENNQLQEVVTNTRRSEEDSTFTIASAIRQTLEEDLDGCNQSMIEKIDSYAKLSSPTSSEIRAISCPTEENSLEIEDKGLSLNIESNTKEITIVACLPFSVNIQRVVVNGTSCSLSNTKIMRKK
jgi:hypothetical protein